MCPPFGDPVSKLLSFDELFRGRHFDAEIIVLCVRRYLAYKLSYRDLAEIVAALGDHRDEVSVREFVLEVRAHAQDALVVAMGAPKRLFRDTLRCRVEFLEFGLFAGGDHPAEVEHDDEPVAHLADAADVFGIDARNEVRRVLDLLDGYPQDL
jgi:hypothetical protein